MAKYKNRNVRIVEELPHPNGDQCKIEHLDLANLGQEIVSRKDVIVSPEELEAIKTSRNPTTSNDFKVELVEKKHTGTLTVPKKENN